MFAISKTSNGERQIPASHILVLCQVNSMLRHQANHDNKRKQYITVHNATTGKMLCDKINLTHWSILYHNRDHALCT